MFLCVLGKGVLLYKFNSGNGICLAEKVLRIIKNVACRESIKYERKHVCFISLGKMSSVTSYNATTKYMIDLPSVKLKKQKLVIIL